MICRLSADLLQMFQQICSRLKTDLLVSYGQAWKFSMEFLGVSWCFGNHSWFAFVVGPKQKGQKMMMMMMVVVVV